MPGILIRFSDSTEVDLASMVPGGSGVDAYSGSVSRLGFMAGSVWDITDMSGMLSPKLYFAFNSRNAVTLRSDALTITPEQQLLEQAVKTHFKEYLTRVDGVIFEALTENGLLTMGADVAFLEDALSQGIKAGVAQYKLTNLVISNYIYESLEQSQGTLKEQFDEEVKRGSKDDPEHERPCRRTTRIRSR